MSARSLPFTWSATKSPIGLGLVEAPVADPAGEDYHAIARGMGDRSRTAGRACSCTCKWTTPPPRSGTGRAPRSPDATASRSAVVTGLTLSGSVRSPPWWNATFTLPPSSGTPSRLVAGGSTGNEEARQVGLSGSATRPRPGARPTPEAPSLTKAASTRQGRGPGQSAWRLPTAVTTSTPRGARGPVECRLTEFQHRPMIGGNLEGGGNTALRVQPAATWVQNADLVGPEPESWEATAHLRRRQHLVGR